MMTETPLLIGQAEREALAGLRQLASEHPVDMFEVQRKIKTPAGKRQHMRQMTVQTVELVFGWAVTFSIENNHPIGTCRHMSMSSPSPDRVPRPEALWMVAEELGFVGGLEQCMSWPEELQGHGVAINLVQPIAMSEPNRDDNRDDKTG